jgi:hypothetical protein
MRRVVRGSGSPGRGFDTVGPLPRRLFPDGRPDHPTPEIAVKNALDESAALRTTCTWIDGAKAVSASTRLILASARSGNGMAKDARQGGKAASIDVRKLERTLGLSDKELKRPNEDWTAQARDVNAAAADWPLAGTGARDRFESRRALERPEGAHSKVFERAPDRTNTHLSACHPKVKARASDFSLAAGKADAMHDALIKARDAIDQTFRLLSAASGAFQPVSGGASATAVKGMMGLKTAMSNRPKSVAKADRSQADAARGAGRMLNVELAELDTLPKELGEMRFIALVRDARDDLKRLIEAA